MKFYSNIKEVDVPVLDDGQLYIYVLENSPQGNIKIGVSTNMQQRLKSLSGSNSGGNKIVKCAVSDATYLYTLEGILHNRFKKYRIEGTEWFLGEEITFEEVCNEVEKLFHADEYKKCNELRKYYTEKLGRHKLKED